MKYSVLMSVYFKEKPSYLVESIESMLHQTVQPDEIVIVEDGPLTLELDAILQLYSEKYPDMIKTVPLSKNVGLGLALNEGLRNCKNNLVARMDTDVISLPNRCQEQLKEFEKDPQLCIVGTQTLEFYDDVNETRTARIVPLNHEDIVRFSKRRSPFNHPTVMYKKDVILNYGAYRDIQRKEDLEMFGRLLSKGVKGKNINKALLLFRSNEQSYSRRKTWSNCSSYIRVIFGFWKKGHSSLFDLFYVVVTQIGMYLAPVSLFKFISDKYLRKAVKDNGTY